MDKHFTPSIEDIYIGYQCEVKDAAPPEEDWKEEVIGKYHEFTLLQKWIDRGELKTVYLTKEQIEQEGWAYRGRSIDIWFEKKGDFERTSWTSYKATMHYNIEDHWLKIEFWDMDHYEPGFHGVCRCINEFRTIIKLLRL